MAKGTVAKTNLINRIIEALGSDYIGNEDNKKFYFNSIEDGQPTQVCITMTCPKTPFAAGEVVSAEKREETSAVPAPAASMSDEDKAKIEELKQRLGII